MAQQMVWKPVADGHYSVRKYDVRMHPSWPATMLIENGVVTTPSLYTRLPDNLAVCELVPVDALTVRMTEERIEALETILDMAIGDAGEGWASAIVQEMLMELKGATE